MKRRPGPRKKLPVRKRPRTSPILPTPWYGKKIMNRKMTKKRLDGRKKLISLSAEMERDLAAYCREKALESESELIRQAIAAYIYADYADETLKLQGLAEIQKKIAELRDMIDISFRYLRLMHINLLSYHPETGRSLTEAAFRSALARHDTFFEAFRDSLRSDPPFFERLLHVFFQEDSRGKG
jgi:metal-responsive CopG/Arc/MetJ family transcriptional regulator